MPFSLTVAVLMTLSATFTVTVAPAVPVPFNILSVDKTLPPNVGVTTGASGFTLTLTSIILDGCFCVASG